MTNFKYYKLTDEDYRSLWMLAAPVQIINEFSDDRTLSVRSIYRRYQKLNLSGIKEHRKAFKAKLQLEKPMVSEAYLNTELRKIEQAGREKAFAQIWSQIEVFEETFNARS